MVRERERERERERGGEEEGREGGMEGGREGEGEGEGGRINREGGLGSSFLKLDNEMEQLLHIAGRGEQPVRESPARTVWPPSTIGLCRRG